MAIASVFSVTSKTLPYGISRISSFHLMETVSDSKEFALLLQIQVLTPNTFLGKLYEGNETCPEKKELRYSNYLSPTVGYRRYGEKS